MTSRQHRPPATDREWSEALSAYMDGELDGEERAALERAMDADPRRAEQLAELRRLSGALRAWGVEEVPSPAPAFLARLAPDRLAARRRRTLLEALADRIARGMRPAGWRWGMAAAGIYFLGLASGIGGFMAFNGALQSVGRGRHAPDLPASAQATGQSQGAEPMTIKTPQAASRNRADDFRDDMTLAQRKAWARWSAKTVADSGADPDSDDAMSKRVAVVLVRAAGVASAPPAPPAARDPNAPVLTREEADGLLRETLAAALESHARDAVRQGDYAAAQALANRIRDQYPDSRAARSLRQASAFRLAAQYDSTEKGY
jgi:hypothetical protein